MADDVGTYWLNSIRNYKNLNKEHHKIYIEKEDRCDVLKDALKKALKKDYTGILDFCKQLGGILNKLNNLGIVSFYDNDTCSVVNYWAYDYMFNKFFKDHSYTDILLFTGNLSHFWKEFGEHNKCYINMTLSNEPYFKLEKTFYDYILDYPTIKHQIDNGTLVCNENLRDYLKNGFKSYETVKDECSADPGKTYCNLLQESTKKYDTGILSEIKCNAYSSRGLDLGGQQDIEDPFGHSPKDESAQGFRALPLTDQDQSSISPSSTPIAVALPTVGALLTSFIFLKFTPLRSWLHGHFAGNKMHMFNEDGEETNTLIDDGYEYPDTYSSMDDHHIHYHAA
ncbi:PIR Superfamily Protein [Plasmodium ovale wallikeri]|uniref:PIR Superfamily Protein n=1 Tax=Plasmodium ovale wallikeri TaxID=864142 RepID=A0A1A9AQR2_PLAOA|nr:PIR Superfamily Protein [Plasmodium ovale wallikeri]